MQQLLYFVVLGICFLFFFMMSYRPSKVYSYIYDSTAFNQYLKVRILKQWLKDFIFSVEDTKPESGSNRIKLVIGHIIWFELVFYLICVYIIY